MINMDRIRKLIPIGTVLIITSITLIPLFNNSFFTIHDNQHIARLFLLDKGLKQGILYPRWVDIMGFGYGYPLFNFYPPLTYYVAEFFHLIGFTFLNSLKLMLVVATFAGAIGTYFLSKKFMNTTLSIVSSIFFAFFSYRALTLYVRGAFAEFLAMSLFPIVLFSIVHLKEKPTVYRSSLFGFVLGLLIIAHPLIAFPSVFFIAFFLMFNFLLSKQKKLFAVYSVLGTILSLCLSAFFWLPSMLERKFTMTDSILLTELASYKIHFIHVFQFWYSPWGYGASLDGPVDGISFQLGKLYILLSALSVLMCLIYLIYKRNRIDASIKNYLIFLMFLVISIFMTTTYSKTIWSSVKFLGYLQFPWRFLSFTSLFIAVCMGYGFTFFEKILKGKSFLKPFRIVMYILVLLLLITIHGKYFKPQKTVTFNETLSTSFKEIAWRVSRRTFEFIPKDVRTIKSEYNTTIPGIAESEISRIPFSILNGSGNIQVLQNRFNKKKFKIDALSKMDFRLHTFSFPGWKAYINNKEALIDDNNGLRLITIDVPKGESLVEFRFEDTLPRIIGSLLSLLGGSFIIALLLKSFILQLKEKH